MLTFLAFESSQDQDIWFVVLILSLENARRFKLYMSSITSKPFDVAPPLCHKRMIDWITAGFLLYFHVQEIEEYSLRSRGLCIVPISCTVGVAHSNGADLWAPIKTTSPKFEKAI